MLALWKITPRKSTLCMILAQILFFLVGFSISTITNFTALSGFPACVHQYNKDPLRKIVYPDRSDFAVAMHL
jgi:hypothetical protein